MHKHFRTSEKPTKNPKISKIMFPIHSIHLNLVN